MLKDNEINRFSHTVSELPGERLHTILLEPYTFIKVKNVKIWIHAASFTTEDY